ncbi:MAG: cysteine desulfurase NifS, partial [Lachnospiraceae bacterium]|nr:cysteine desulfurase NifS [Lachnospiraceae bacterium]
GAGSACSSHEKHVSNTLSNIGLKKDYYDKAVRFSFSRFNTIEEIDKAVDIIMEKYAVLSRFVRK